MTRRTQTRWLAPVCGVLMLAPLHASPGFAEDAAPAEQAKPVGEVLAPKTVTLVAKAEKVPYIGLVVSPTTPEARAQLQLPEGVGLTVLDVADQSPAEEAGLKRHDILRKLDDQLLVNQQQMGTLVRMHGSDKEVTLTILRGGQEQQVKLTIGQTTRQQIVAQPRHQIRFGPQGVQLLRVGPDGQVQVGDGPDADRIKQIEAQLERMRNEVLNNDAMDDAQRQRLQQMIDEAKAVQPRGAMPAGPGVNMTRSMRIADKEHVIQINVTNGDKRLNVTDREGNAIFEGPINTDQERAAVPEDVMAKVNKLEKRANVRIQFDRRDQPEGNAPAEPQGHKLN